MDLMQRRKISQYKKADFILRNENCKLLIYML